MKPSEFNIEYDFTKGINRRSPVEFARPNELYTAQNARINARGDMGYVNRKKGYTPYAYSQGTDPVYDYKYDMIEYQNFVILFWADRNDTSGSDVATHLTIKSVDNASPFLLDKSWYAPLQVFGKLTLQENTIYVSPFNKQLNYIGGSWLLNDFISVTPSFVFNVSANGSFATGSLQITNDISGVPTAATFVVTVTANNIPGSTQETWHLTVGGTSTSDIVSWDTDTVDDIANEIVTAAGVLANWTAVATLTTDPSAPANPYVTFTYTTTGTVGNGIITTATGNTDVTISISGSSSGGVGDTDGTMGPVRVTIGSLVDVTTTTHFNTGDTKAIVAQDVVNTLNADGNFTSYYKATYTPGSDIINYTSKIKDTIYNVPITFYPQYTQLTSVVNGMSGATYPGGNLESDTNYWYKMAYVYVDGHITKTCNPKLFKTTSAQKIITISIDVAIDLDGSYCAVQIYRKKEDGQFYLIDKILPSGVTNGAFDYVDNGKPELGDLKEQEYVWDSSHKTQAVVADRLVRGNITYPTRNNDYTLLETTPVVDNNLTKNVLPRNATIDIFAQARFNDGTLDYHHFLRTIGSSNDIKRVQVKQTGLLNDAKEISFYARNKFAPVNSKLQFGCPEIYNINLPSVATSDLAPASQDKPSNPHLFLGFKHIVRAVVSHDGDNNLTGDYWHATPNWDWDTDIGGGDTWDSYFNKEMIEQGTMSSGYDQLATALPETITVNLFGVDVLYERIAYSHPNLDPNGTGHTLDVFIGAYKLAMFDSIQRAVAAATLKIKMVSNQVSGALSSTKNNSEYLNTEFTVQSILDTSSNQSELRANGDGASDTPANMITHTKIGVPDNNRVYAVLDAASVFSAIDNVDINSGVSKTNLDDGINYPFQDDFTHVYPYTLNAKLIFEFVNLAMLQSPQLDAYTGTDSTTDGGLYTYDAQPASWSYVKYKYNTVFYTVNILAQLNDSTLIYLGTKPNQIDSGYNDLDEYGFTANSISGLSIDTPNDENVYTTLISETDFKQFTTEHSNLLIWGEKIVLDSQSSGIRNFTFSNFKNISNVYGEIVDIRAHNRKLIVFCKRGVAIVNVGERLTQQASGSVYVESSLFLTDYFWPLKNLNSIQRRSIKAFAGNLFFTDGTDVFMIETSGQPKNISNGLIQLSLSANGYCTGAIDPYNKTYNVSDDTQTWIYSIETGQWYGPFTYREGISAHYQKSRYFVPEAENILMLDEQGNTISSGGVTSRNTTIIESVANDLGNLYIDKQFKRFYLDVEYDATDITGSFTFSYSLDRVTWETVDIMARLSAGTLSVINGNILIGIANSQQIGKQIFWKLQTTLNNFVLQGLTLQFIPKVR